eukprot:scaffold234183_cov25-Prasinocladus_malaysianus.AAC.1
MTTGTIAHCVSIPIYAYRTGTVTGTGTARRRPGGIVRTRVRYKGDDTWYIVLWLYEHWMCSNSHWPMTGGARH